MEKALQHFEQNRPEFETYLRTNAELQLGMDILQPLIKPFKEVNPKHNMEGCKDCILDMLRWYQIQAKKAKTKEKDASTKGQ